MRQRKRFDSRTTGCVTPKIKQATEDAPANGLLDGTLQPVGSDCSDFMNDSIEFGKRAEQSDCMFSGIAGHFLLGAKM